MPRKSFAPNNLKRFPFSVREAVGSNIKRHRLALGWSQQELADSFGVSRAAVSQYETAVPFGPDRDPSLRTSPEFYRLHTEVYTLLTAERQASLEYAPKARQT